jgi:hypothetical protein
MPQLMSACSERFLRFFIRAPHFIAYRVEKPIGLRSVPAVSGHGINGVPIGVHHDDSNFRPIREFGVRHGAPSQEASHDSNRP